MQQHDGIVDGKHQLEDCRNGEGHIRNTFKNDVTAHVNHNGNTNGNQQENRLKEGFAHQKQYDNTNDDCHGNESIQNIQLCTRVIAVNRMGALISLVHLLDDGTYFVIVAHILGVYNVHSKCFGVVLYAICLIVNTLNTFKLDKLLVNRLSFGGSQALKHNLKAILEFDDRKLLFHNFKALIHIGILGKILRLIFVDCNLWNQKGTKKSKCNTYYKEEQSVLY